MLRKYFLFVLFAAPSIVGWAQQYNFEVLSIEQGLPQAGVYDITQDNRGNLWIATEGGGACVYNGVDFKIMGLESGLKDNTIRCVYKDRRGNVWLGTQNAGLAKYRKGKVTSYHTGKGFTEDHVRTIVEDSSGIIWIGTLNGGLAKFQDDKFTFYTEKEGFPSNNIRYSAKDSSGTVWFCTDNGVVKLKGGKFLTYSTEDGLAHNKVLTAYVDDKNQIWFGSRKGVSIYADGGFHTLDVPEIMQERIRAINQDIFGNYWVGTQNGLLKLSADTSMPGGYAVEVITKNNGLSNERIRSIYRDRSGALWIGTYFGGVCKYTGEEFVLYNQQHGFPDENITALHLDTSGTFYLGTFEGTLFSFTTKKAVSVLYTSHEDNEVNRIRKEGETIWLATSAEGLVEVTPNGAIVHDTFGGRLINSFSDVLVLGDTVLALNESGLILYNKQTKEAKRITISKGFAEGTVLEKFGDKVYIGSSFGLHEALVTSLEEAKRIDGIDGRITDLAMDSKQNIWVATSGNGLFKLNKKGKVSDFDVKSDYIKLLSFDSLENMWLGYHRGIEWVEIDPTQTFILGNQFYSLNEGFSGTEVNYRAAVLDREGNTWFGTIRGLAKYNEDKAYHPAAPPLTHINDVRLFYEEVDWSQYADVMDPSTDLPVNLVLDYQNNHLTFHFLGVDLFQPEKVRYEHILEGYEDEWSNISALNEITYSNLPPGKYTFKVRARSSDAIWDDEPTTFSFTITPPFWEETWFIILASLLGGGLIYLVITIRIRMLQRQKRVLEEKVRERTYALNVEKQESERLLLNILPKSTAEELKKHNKTTPQDYEETTVLFSDFKGFTKLTEDLSPGDLVKFLDDCFQGFDSYVEEFGVEKIKTIGDAYMCATGIPEPDEDHAVNMVGFAKKMLEVMQEVNAKYDGPDWDIRIGIHSGPLITGVVGKKKFAYDVWGDTVNVAARMESSSEPNRINISTSTYEKVKDSFKCTPRGMVKAKGKGEMEMYFVE